MLRGPSGAPNAAPRCPMPRHPITSFRRAKRLALALLCLATPALRAQDNAAMDKLLAPIALYPDALLAQVLTCSTSPDQVGKFNTWLQGEKEVSGSDLQKAAMDAGFDASFASLALFPDVMSTLADNMDWTKELGTAYLSDQKGVMASVQRLRTEAKNAGNLKTNEQQKVTVESEGGSQVIVIEPANPQVVYVPAYDPQVVYTSAPPPQQSGSGGGAVAAALIGFGLGVAVGAAIDNDPYYYGPYGWGAWGFGWHGGGVYYQRSVWVVPVRPRYPYVRPVPGYRPRPNVYAPRRTNVNINVDRSRTNIGNNVNIGNKTNNVDRSRTNVGDRTTNVGDKNVNVGDRNAGDRAAGDRTANAANRTATNESRAATSSAASRGRTAPSATSAPRSTPNRSAMSGYSNGSSAHAASNRGRSSVGGSRGGGGGRRR
jgi:Protein of unknown function (DUF3300)